MKKVLIFALIFFIIVGVPLSKKFFGSENNKKVSIEKISLQTIKASILASGQLKHEEQVNLSAEVIGKVSKLYVEEGDHVTKGQLVLEIDDQSYLAAVEQQEAAVDQQRVAIEKQSMVVENLKKQLNRKIKLFKQNLLDKNAFETANHTYEVARVDLKASKERLKQVAASLAQAKERLSKTKIVSPIDGNITSLDIKVGETAISSSTNIAGSSLMTIANPNSMLAEINVDEADISHLEIGQKAEIIAIAFSSTPIKGTVTAIASSAKKASGRQSLSFAVKLNIEFPETINLRPGMSCRAEIFTQGEQKLLAVPLKAIQVKEDNDSDLVENYIFIVKDNIAEQTKITVGISDDNFQHVISGVNKDDTVIVGPDQTLRTLRNGDKVTLIDDSQESVTQ